VRWDGGLDKFYGSAYAQAKQFWVFDFGRAMECWVHLIKMDLGRKVTFGITS